MASPPVAPHATPPAPTVDLTALDAFLRRTRYAQDQLIEALHVAQDLHGHLTDSILLHLARQLGIPPSRVYGVATFYHLFSFDPPGEHTCTVCTGTACFVKGADALVAAVEEQHEVVAGAITADGRLGLTTARCLGSCGLAPVLVLDGEVHGEQTADTVLAALRTALEEEPLPQGDVR